MNRFLLPLGISIFAVTFVFMVKTDIGNAIGTGAPFLLFLSSVMISAWYGGLFAGILSTFFSAFICLFFYLPPYNSFAIHDSATVLQLLVYICEAVAISFFMRSYRNIVKRIDKFKYSFPSTLQEMFILLRRNRIFRYLIVIFLFSYIVFILKLFINQIPEMSFVDAFNNYVGGYFLLKGKSLYSQIFFNHQMLMAYISAIIQFITHPTSLSKLVAYHRLFMFLLSSTADILLIWRFGYKGLGFVLFYELCDFYLFGNFFLGEAILVYPSVYLLGVIWEKLNKKKISNFDLLVSGLFVWFIIFLRETFIPLALLFYFTLLWTKKWTRFHTMSVCFFLFLSCLTLAAVPMHDYFFQLVTTNLKNNIAHDITRNHLLGIGFFEIFFYPLALFVPGNWNFFHIDMLCLDGIFLTLFFIYIFKLKRIKPSLFIFFSLAFAAIRFTPPGTILYGSFHLLPWFGLFIFTIFLMLSELYVIPKMKNITNILFILLICAFGYLVLTFRWFSLSNETFEQKFDRNYGRYYAHGMAIKVLANKHSTLFVDGWDSLIYYVANIPSSYKYTLYYPVMDRIPEYQTLRRDMFRTSPPDFYYTDCEQRPINLPQFVRGQYVRLLHNNTPGCLFVKNSILLEISNSQKQQLEKLGFKIPTKT